MSISGGGKKHPDDSVKNHPGGVVKTVKSTSGAWSAI